jgi:ribosomal protein L33
MGFSFQISLQAKKYCVADNNHESGVELACHKTSENFYPTDNPQHGG